MSFELSLVMFHQRHVYLHGKCERNTHAKDRVQVL